MPIKRLPRSELALLLGLSTPRYLQIFYTCYYSNVNKNIQANSYFFFSFTKSLRELIFAL